MDTWQFHPWETNLSGQDFFINTNSNFQKVLYCNNQKKDYKSLILLELLIFATSKGVLNWGKWPHCNMAGFTSGGSQAQSRCTISFAKAFKKSSTNGVPPPKFNEFTPEKCWKTIRLPIGFKGNFSGANCCC